MNHNSYSRNKINKTICNKIFCGIDIHLFPNKHLCNIDMFENMLFYYQPIAELDRESQKVLQKQRKTTKSAIPILCRITHNFFTLKPFSTTNCLIICRNYVLYCSSNHGHCNDI